MSFINSILNVFVGSKSKKDLKEVEGIVKQILIFEKEFSLLTHDELRSKTVLFKNIIKDSRNPFNNKIETLNSKIQSSSNIDEKDEYYTEIDLIKEESNKNVEEVLNEILPQAFAVVKETAKRFKENSEITVKSNEFDLRLSSEKTYVKTDGDSVIWSNKWNAAGKEVTWDMVHYDVQLIGGIVLHRGKVAEMQTGEGKTLVATLPAYLNALTNKGVHIVTVNDYLASRDQVSMGQIYRFLGLDTGLIQEDMAFLERQQNYKADITYVTNNELAFDYLRDNMASNLSQVVLPPFNYCIVDEVDSIFIDEAQVPLIISQAVETCIDKYIVAAEVAEYLEVNIHFKVDEKNRNIILTEQGTAQIEKILQVEDLYNPNDPWIPYILSAIKATALFFRNIHYIVQNNQIIIVDEFTGRIMPDRRWNEGLHQAVEAKEGVPIRQNTETAASITYQNFFLLYPKLSGMTGTAKTSEVEFEKIYNLPVEEIPTARPNLRKDLPDFVYKDSLTKWTAVARECKSIAKTKQPILIGTTTVENSEMLADLLKEYQLSYRLLNAKPENVKRESEIVAQAGEIGSITIATNMAGRGTDIILGGNITFKVRKQLYNILVSYKNQTNSTNLNNIFPLTKGINFTSQKFLSVLNSLLNDSKFLSLSSTGILKFLNEIDQIRIPTIPYQCSIKFLLSELEKFEKKNQNINNKIVKNLGGLYIIGTERNNSRRIDNQLRGRCGRQGDPGTSRFFLSLEDSLFRNFGSSKLQNFMQNQLLDDLPLESNLLTKSLDAAQKRVEERDYDGRKYLFDYDDILNKQRNIVYYERRKLLESQSLRETILAYGEQVIKDIINLLKSNILNNL